MSEEPVYVELEKAAEEDGASKKPRYSKILLVWLIFSQLFISPYCLFLVAGMIWGAGDMQVWDLEAVAAMLFYSSLVVFPIVSAILAWRAYLQKKNSKAFRWSMLVFLSPIVFVLFLFLDRLVG